MKKPEPGLVAMRSLIDFKTDKMPMLGGDLDKISYRKNILENYVGFELQEMEDDDCEEGAKVEGNYEIKGLELPGSVINSRDNSRVSPVQPTSLNVIIHNEDLPSRVHTIGDQNLISDRGPDSYSSRGRRPSQNIIPPAEQPPQRQASQPPGLISDREPLTFAVILEIRKREQLDGSRSYLLFMLTLVSQNSLLLFMAFILSLAQISKMNIFLWAIATTLISDIALKVAYAFKARRERRIRASLPGESISKYRTREMIEYVSAIKDLLISIFLVGFVRSRFLKYLIKLTIMRIQKIQHFWLFA